MLVFISFIFGIGISLLTLFVLQRGYFFSSSLKLKETLTQVTYLYPNQKFFGYRILYLPEDESITNEMQFMGLKRIKEIESSQFELWINSHFDIFIAVKVGPKTDLVPFEIQDLRIGTRLFYAYESIITLPINLGSNDLTHYLRKLSLIKLSTELCTSIWITHCESLPGYLDVSEILGNNFHFHNLNQSHSLAQALHHWQECVHQTLITHIPPAATPSHKAEQLALSHQFKNFIENVTASASGHLARTFPCGYILLVNDHPSHELVDHLYEKWHVSSVHSHHQVNTYSMPWLSPFLRSNHDSQSLNGIYLAVSLFSIFALITTYISRNATLPVVKTASAAQETLQNQLLSEISASTKLPHLIKLMSLHQEMTQPIPAPDRCERFQALIDPLANCPTINRSKMDALPSELSDKIQYFVQSVPRQEQLTALVGSNFIQWPSHQFKTKLNEIPFQKICQLDKRLHLKLLPPLVACQENLTQEIIKLYVDQKTQQMIRSSVPYHANDDFTVIANTAHYFEQNPQELLGNYAQDLQDLRALNDAFPFDYETLSQIKSMAHLAKDHKLIKKVFHDVYEISHELQRAKDVQQLIHVYTEILNNRWNIQSLLASPNSSSLITWKKAVFKQLLAAVKSKLTHEIHAQWQPLFHAYETHLKGHYPINPSGNDVNVAQFNELIGPSGSMTQFFQNIIEPLVDNQKRTWIWQKNGPLDLGLDDTLINTSMQLAILTEMYFHHKTAPWLEFTVQTKTLSPQVNAVSWQIANQSMTLNPNKQAELVVWSSLDTSSQFSIITLHGTDGQKKQISFQGPLSPLRLFDEVKVTPGSSPQIFSIRVQKDSWWAEFEVHLPHAINPLLNTAARKISLQSNIVRNS